MSQRSFFFFSFMCRYIYKTLVKFSFQYINILVFHIFKWDRMEKNQKTDKKNFSITKYLMYPSSSSFRHWTGKTIFFISLISYYVYVLLKYCLCFVIILYLLWNFCKKQDTRLGISFSHFHQFQTFKDLSLIIFLHIL